LTPKFVGSAYSKTTGAEGFFYLARHYRARSAAGILQRPFYFSEIEEELRREPFAATAGRSYDDHPFDGVGLALTMAEGDAGRRVRPKWSRSSLHRDENDPGAHHAERAGRAERKIDHAALNEGPPVIDPTPDRVSSIGDGDHAAERTSPVRAGHFSVMAPPAVIGSQSIFRPTCRRRACDNEGSPYESFHGRGPPNRTTNLQTPRGDKVPRPVELWIAGGLGSVTLIFRSRRHARCKLFTDHCPLRRR